MGLYNMARPPSTTPTKHSNFNLPEDVIDIIGKEQGKDNTEKIVNLIRKTQTQQQNPLKENIYYHEQRIKKLIEQLASILQKINESYTQKETLQFQAREKEEKEKALANFQRGFELREIFHKNIVDVLKKPDMTIDKMREGWIQLISLPEYKDVEYGNDLFDLLIKEFDLENKIKETKEKEDIEEKVEEEIEEDKIEEE